VTYHIVTAGKPGQPSYEIIWKGNLSNPIAVCGDFRNACTIRDLLNEAEKTTEGKH